MNVHRQNGVFGVISGVTLSICFLSMREEPGVPNPVLKELRFAGILGMPTGPFLYADQLMDTLHKKAEKR